MSIRAVFGVQCDGPCKGWLSRTEDYVLGTDALAHHNEVLPTAERAWLWLGERAARAAARDAGWCVSPGTRGVQIMCPRCQLNPGGIRLPPQCGTCGHVHGGRVCGHVTSGFPCICMNERDDE